MKNARQSSQSDRQRLRSLTALIALAALVALVIVAAHSIAFAQAGAGGTQATAQKADNAPAGNAKNGKAVYTADGCYECHGREAQGGAGTGPKLGPNPIPFAAFVFQVRTPRDQMPPYTAKVLSDADLADIYAFAQSQPQPPKADSIPPLK